MASSRNNTLEFSSAGSVIADSSSGQHSGSFGAIQFLKDSEIADLNSTNIENDGNLASESFTAGTIIYGNFTMVELTSGLAALHRI